MSQRESAPHLRQLHAARSTSKGSALPHTSAHHKQKVSTAAADSQPKQPHIGVEQTDGNTEHGNNSRSREASLTQRRVSSSSSLKLEGTDYEQLVAHVAASIIQQHWQRHRAARVQAPFDCADDSQAQQQSRLSNGARGAAPQREPPMPYGRPGKKAGEHQQLDNAGYSQDGVDRRLVKQQKMQIKRQVGSREGSSKHHEDVVRHAEGILEAAGRHPKAAHDMDLHAERATAQENTASSDAVRLRYPEQSASTSGGDCAPSHGGSNPKSGMLQDTASSRKRSSAVGHHLGRDSASDRSLFGQASNQTSRKTLQRKQSSVAEDLTNRHGPQKTCMLAVHKDGEKPRVASMHADSGQVCLVNALG